jgi:hypothetical protein
MIRIYDVMPFQTFYAGKYGKITHDEKLANTLIKNFHAGVTGFELPMFVDHGEKTTTRYGDIKDLWIENNRLKAAVDLNSKGEAIKEDYAYVSPSYARDYKNKMTGQRVGPTLIEISLTNTPMQPGMEKVKFGEETEEVITEYYALKEENSIKKGDETEMDKDVIKLYEDNLAEKGNEIVSLKEQIAKKDAEIVKLSEQITQLTEDAAKHTEEIKKLSESLAKLTAEKTKGDMESWAKDWENKGYAPAVVKSFKDQIISGGMKVEMAESILKTIAPITERGREVPSGSEATTEKLDKFAESLAENIHV